MSLSERSLRWLSPFSTGFSLLDFDWPEETRAVGRVKGYCWDMLKDRETETEGGRKEGGREHPGVEINMDS